MKPGRTLWVVEWQSDGPNFSSVLMGTYYSEADAVRGVIHFEEWGKDRRGKYKILRCRVQAEREEEGECQSDIQIAITF